MKHKVIINKLLTKQSLGFLSVYLNLSA